jgi:hypothetical protein
MKLDRPTGAGEAKNRFGAEREETQEGRNHVPRRTGKPEKRGLEDATLVVMTFA